MNYNDKSEFDFCASYMVADEVILWKGKPDSKIIFKAENTSNMLSGIFLLGFSLFWCVGASGGFQSLAWVLGAPLVAIGIYLVIGRPIHVSYMRKKTYYVITNKKIIRLYKDRIDTIDGRCLPQMHIRGFKDGFGNIYFGQRIAYVRNGRTRYSYEGGYFHLERVPIKAVQIALDKLIDGEVAEPSSEEELH